MEGHAILHWTCKDNPVEFIIGRPLVFILKQAVQLNDVLALRRVLDLGLLLDGVGEADEHAGDGRKVEVVAR